MIPESVRYEDIPSTDGRSMRTTQKDWVALMVARGIEVD